MRTWYRVIIFGCLLSALWSCKSERKAEHAFYYWKTELDNTSPKEVEDMGADHFYMHYFDVEWNEAYGIPTPVYDIQFNNKVDVFTEKGITPVVFITNQSFEKISLSSCDTFAQLIYNRIEQTTKRLYKAKGDVVAIKEIQIDCDWTAGTRDKYFAFLRKLKQLYAGKKLSATIRLYPYKYKEKMGVPPVDKGVLMCYNLGKIQSGNTGNSILDIKELKQYLGGGKYPLHLDIALPIFGWYVWFSGNTYKGIIYDEENMIGDIAQAKDDSHYIVKADTVLGGSTYFREGDILRMEYPKAEDIKTAVELLSKEVKYDRIIFYHWDSQLTGRYESTIKEVFSKY